MIDTETLAHRLQAGIQRLGVDVTPGAQQCLLQYVHTLHKWNQSFNLTAVREPQEMISRHILDSLSILPYVSGPRVLDIGTGPGLPGMVLAIARPDWSLSLLDSKGKKIRFLVQFQQQAGLENVEIIQERIEKFQPEEKFDTLVTRAFAALPKFLAGVQGLCAPGGRIVAMKGHIPDEELAAVVADNYKVVAVKAMVVPGVEAARHVVIIEPRE